MRATPAFVRVIVVATFLALSSIVFTGCPAQPATTANCPGGSVEVPTGKTLVMYFRTVTTHGEKPASDQVVWTLTLTNGTTTTAPVKFAEGGAAAIIPSLTSGAWTASSLTRQEGTKPVETIKLEPSKNVVELRGPSGATSGYVFLATPSSGRFITPVGLTLTP